MEVNDEAISKSKASVSVSNELNSENAAVHNVIDIYRQCMKQKVESSMARLALDTEDLEKLVAGAIDELGGIHDYEEGYKLTWYVDSYCNDVALLGWYD